MIKIPVEPPITDFLHRKASALRLPLNGTFELNPTCNMNCKMCYVRLSKEQQEAIAPLKTSQEWIDLGRRLRDEGMLYLLLTGGEPFLRPDFKDILTGLHELGLVISINSNGTLIDEKVVEWLKLTPPTRINITLYGGSDETYERLCGCKDGFTRVTKAIRLLKEAGIMVKINCSITPYNKDDIEKIFEYVSKEQLIIQPTSYMFPPLRKDKTMIGQNLRLTSKEASYYAAKCEMWMNGEDDFLERMKTKEFKGLMIDSEDCVNDEGGIVQCRAGRCSFWITWEGKLLPCGMFPTNGISVFDHDFKDVWKQTVEWVNNIRLPGKCNHCSLKEQCKACAAMVICETGSFDKVPTYRCEMAQYYEESCLKIQEEILERRKIDE